MVPKFTTQITFSDMIWMSDLDHILWIVVGSAYSNSNSFLLWFFIALHLRTFYLLLGRCLVRFCSAKPNLLRNCAQWKEDDDNEVQILSKELRKSYVTFTELRTLRPRPRPSVKFDQHFGIKMSIQRWRGGIEFQFDLENISLNWWIQHSIQHYSNSLFSKSKSVSQIS